MTLSLTNTFSTLRLIEPLQRAVRDSGYTTPTPIQSQAIPHLLEGRDLLGCAKTGTGKTAAFALPMLQLLSEGGRRAAPNTVRALILAPTRELAAQVAESFNTYGRGLKLSVAVIFGGVNQRPQVAALHRGVDILVATPGRLVDLMGQRHAHLGAVEILVLDEADHMLDLGFIPDVKRILATLPKKRQTLFFSATMPPPIQKLADGMLHDPVKVFVTPPSSTVEEIRQSVHFVDRASKPTLLAQLLAAPEVERALVFTRTKHGADKVARRLVQGGITAAAIHGNKAQNNRERTLEGFRAGRLHVLVATDIAARGIDVDGITHVVNFDLPNVPETYVHRIGRTGRAGASGIAISLCDREEREFLRDIEKLIKRPVPIAGGEHALPRAAQGSAAVAPRAPTEREKASGEFASSERAPRERAPRPHGPRDHSARDRASRENDPRRLGLRDHGPYAPRGPARSAPGARTHAAHGHEERAPAPRGPAQRGGEHRGGAQRGPSHRGAAAHGPRGAAAHAGGSRAPAHRGPAAHGSESRGHGSRGQGPRGHAPHRGPAPHGAQQHPKKSGGHGPGATRRSDSASFGSGV